MRVIWTRQAEQDRADIWDYIAADNPVAAARLSEHPKMGKPGRVAGTRELIPHESYRMVYEIHGETVWLLVLIHTARQWPPGRR